MVIRGSNKKFVDMRKAAKDIVNSAKKNASTGSRFEFMARVRARLKGLLRSDVLK